jgi:nucleoid DNA-binding protein
MSWLSAPLGISSENKAFSGILGRRHYAACVYEPQFGGRAAETQIIAEGDVQLTKADLIDTVADEGELSKRQAGQIVDLILDEIKSALQKGDRVALTPFGSFVVRTRRAREGRNPKTGERIKIPTRKVPAFVSGKALKEAVGGPRSGARKAAKKRR